MKIAGIANGYSYDSLKKGRYKFIIPVLERDGKYYTLNHKNVDIYTLIDMTANIAESLRDAWLKGFFQTSRSRGKRCRKYL